MMGEWAVGYWIVGVTSFQKIYGLYGVEHHKVEISGDVTKAGRTDKQTIKERLCYSESEQGNAMFNPLNRRRIISI